MEQQRPFLIISEVKQKLPILIVDKHGRLGSALAKKLQEQFLIVLVSGTKSEVGENIIHIPYRRRIPMIPDNSYSHFFLFYNGESEMLDMLPSFVKKANATSAHILFITSIFETSRKLFAHLSNHAYYHITKVVYGELFDDTASDRGTVNVFIQQARAFGRIEIPNDGLGKLYPILLDDVLTALVGIAFVSEPRHKVLLVFPPYASTELSIGRMLQTVHPLLKLDFRTYKARPLAYYWPEESESVVQNYALEDRLRQISIESGQPYEMREKKQWRFPQRRAKKKLFWSMAAALCVVLMFPIVVSLVCFGIGGVFFAWSVQSLESARLSEAKQQVAIADTTLVYSEQFFQDTLLPDVIAQQQKEAFVGQITTLREAVSTEEDILQAAALLTPILSGTSASPKSDFLQVVALTKKSLISLQKMKAENTLPAAIVSKLHATDTVLPLLENTIDEFTPLLGFDGTKTYLLLFQNNMELRPGGGFIGSYGVLQMTNGRMEDLQTFDVYDADGRLMQHVQPPFGLQRYLGATNWFLRDSNFDPDFVRDAATAMQFYTLETGKHVDGVVAIDTDFLKGMLSVFGPVSLPDYHETVDANNFYLLTERHAENNFFPGSTQKKDFLRSLYSALLLKMNSDKSFPARQVIGEIGTLLKQKHLLFAFPQLTSQKLFTVNDLSSSLWDGRVGVDNTFLDYLGVIDANVGANKSNYYLRRSIEQEVVVSAVGDAQAKINVTYINSSQSTSPFGGDYKNYLRFVLPGNAVLQGVSINDQIMQTTPAIIDPAVFTAPKFVPPAGLEVEKSSEQGKALYGFLLTVPAGKTVTAQITYSLPHVFDPQSPAFTYDLQLFKQPGTEDDPYTLLLGYPAGFQPVSMEKGMIDVGGKLLYNGHLNQDQEIRAEFSRK